MKSFNKECQKNCQAAGGDKLLVQYLEIGKIINTHGVSGEVKVLPLTDNPDRYKELEWAYIDKKGRLEKYDIESVRIVRNIIIVKFDGINDMNSASGLKDKMIKVDRKHAVKLPEHSYFICDLIGMNVFKESGEKLGELKDVIKTGANDVFVIETENKKEVLIPALKSIVRSISIEDNVINVVLPEGLAGDEV